MPEIDIHALPLLPLTTGVVLPGMVVTLTIESEEARGPPRAGPPPRPGEGPRGAPAPRPPATAPSRR